jgi:hypothetical protein
MANTVCALPGCAELVDTSQAQFRRGYCENHGDVAIVDALENVAGYLDQLVAQADRIARHLEGRA